MRILVTRGFAVRMALASIAVALVALAIITVSVLQVARDQFEHLMMSHGATQADATAMFRQTVGVVFVVAAMLAVLASVILATILSRYLARPLRAMETAAHRLARGDYSVRVHSGGPSEVRAVADSFNRMADSLEQQEHVRTEFIAGAAHELLTPLTNLQGYLEGLRDGVVAADTAVFASLHEEAERLVRLSRSLLTLSKVDDQTLPDRSETVDLSVLVAATVELTQQAFERRRISVSARLPVKLAARISADRATQVMFNLLQNAARYTDEGGQVTVAGGDSNEMVRLEVTNTGPGIPADDLPFVFERFYRVDKSRDREGGGHGLGLALVKQLVEASGGEAGVDSAAGLTRFWVTLPGT